MRRRDFIAGLTCAAVLPAVASAQQGNLPRVGILVSTDPTGPVRYDVFTRRLAELGWVDGRTVRVDAVRYENNTESVRARAAELVRMAPQVIVSTSSALKPLKQLTTSIPVVFVLALDPVAEGFVASLARPGGNMTGFAGFDPAFSGKYLQLIKEAAPTVRRALFIYDPIVTGIGRFPAAAAAAAPALGLDFTAKPVGDATDIRRAIETFASHADGGMWVPSNPAINANLELVLALTRQHRIPTIGVFRFYANAGGLMSYGPDDLDMYKGAASYADRILKGEKPSDLPVQYPSKYQFVINQATAKSIGLELTPAVLSLADELIE
jgi:putative tryptophan/tyrosine transport system substrate-binding protein